VTNYCDTLFIGVHFQNVLWPCRVMLPRRVAITLVSRTLFVDILHMEIVCSVTQDGDGGYVAECLSQDIFTQSENWEGLRANVREAVAAHFFDRPKPTAIRLHLVRDEVLAAA